MTIEKLEAAIHELQERARLKLVQLAWTFARGHVVEPDELRGVLQEAQASWEDFKALCADAAEGLEAGRTVASIDVAEKELADVRQRLATAVAERDRVVEKAEQKVVELNDRMVALEAAIRSARQRWATARERWPGPDGDRLRQAVQQVATLRGELARREAELQEATDAIAARQTYANAMSDMDPTGVRKDAAAIEQLQAKADGVRAEIERLRQELAQAEAAAAQAEQRLLELAGQRG